MVLGKLPVPGRPTIWIRVGQGPTALEVGVVWTFLLSSILFSPHSPSLWETARHRLKYCLKGLLNPKQPTNIIIFYMVCMEIVSFCRIIPLCNFQYRNHVHSITLIFQIISQNLLQI